MKTSILLATGFILAVASPVPAQLNRFTAARETAEFLLKKGGKEVAEEGAEKLTGRIAVAASKYGDDSIRAIYRCGPRAIALADEAGEAGAKVMRLMSKHGDEAADLVLSSPGPKAIFLRYGDEGAEALIRHPGVAEGVIETAGEPAIRALARVSEGNGRHVAMMFGRNGDLAGVARKNDLIEVIGKFGDIGCSFIWRNKKLLLGGATLLAFLDNPEPFINGTVTLADSALKHVVGPALVPVGEASADLIRQETPGLLAWALPVVIAILVIAGVVARLQRRDRRDQSR